MRNQVVTGITLLGTCGFALAGPTDWVEAGDAGQNGIGAAQSVLTVGGLTTITGSLPSLQDVDLFKFTITSPAAFSASSQINGGSSVPDTMLFLFDSAGMGVAFNDDTSGFSQGGTLPMGNALYAALAAGTYYMAISQWNNHALSVGGTMFPTAAFHQAILGPTLSELCV